MIKKHPNPTRKSMNHVKINPNHQAVEEEAVIAVAVEADAVAAHVDVVVHPVVAAAIVEVAIADEGKFKIRLCQNVIIIYSIILHHRYRHNQGSTHRSVLLSPQRIICITGLVKWIHSKFGLILTLNSFLMTFQFSFSITPDEYNNEQ